MQNLPEAPLLTKEPHTQPRLCAERIEDYLEHLIAPLVGIVPYSERHAFRQEAHAHLAGLICEFQYEGQEATEATESALREFGEPWKLGQAFLQEWSQGTPRLSPSGLIRKAALTAFGGFGAGSMLTLLMLEVYAYNPYQDTLVSLIGILAFSLPLLRAVSLARRCLHRRGGVSASLWGG